jgi:transcriptional regulator with XRE-family HTH domain
MAVDIGTQVMTADAGYALNVEDTLGRDAPPFPLPECRSLNAKFSGQPTEGQAVPGAVGGERVIHDAIFPYSKDRVNGQLSNSDHACVGDGNYDRWMAARARKAVPRDRNPKYPLEIFVRERMVANGWSQAALAERIGVSEGTMSKLLNWEMEWTNTYLTRAADAFGIPVADLFLRPAEARTSQNERLIEAAQELPEETRKAVYALLEQMIRDRSIAVRPEDNAD